MASSTSNSAAGFSLFQLEAGLSRSSLTSDSTDESTTIEQTAAETHDIMPVTEAQPLEESAGLLEQPLAMGMAIVRPDNFGLVVPGVYRSSYPKAQDFAFLQNLKLKTIITLVQKELPDGYQVFLDGNGIRHVVFAMTGTKKADVPLAMMRSIIGLVADQTNHPLLIHCNQGKHRTGCVVGILRMYHGWDRASALNEYERYAYPKVRPTDVQYLREFQLANLRHIVARREGLEQSSLSMGRFICFYVVAVLGLLVWFLSTCGIMSFPVFDPPRRPRVSEI